MSTDKYLAILRQYWGYEDFRGIQREIIESIGNGKDTLGLMPTGGGKSITFQVPALAMNGLCIVITPLIALMKDQVFALERLNIKAAAIHSGLSHQEILQILDNCIYGSYKILYVSPERIASDIFQKKLRHINICFITVDEAHCICQWGYDFRPAYLHIIRIRQLVPKAPILALTATATKDTIEDIQHQLQFKKNNVFRMSFERPNLAYIVKQADLCELEMFNLLKSQSGSCIIYTRNRIYCQELSEKINKNGISATFYHAGLFDYLKDERQRKWQNDEIRVMVATNAFGMGIDKPNVRLVIHMDMPDSIEAYFQEAGRAGRDGKPAKAILLLDGKELETSKRRIAQTYPKIDYIKDVYEKICYYLQLAIGDGFNVTREFNIQKFCRTFKFHPLMTQNALILLDRAGYLEYRFAEEGNSRVKIKSTRNELYKLTDPQKERIINCLMRNYGGIFVNFVYIDEELIEQETGTSREIIYQELVELSKRNIIEYIPKKNIPTITYRKRRVDTKEIVLPKSVYVERKDAYIKRLEEMHNYCLCKNTCRSQLILSYFGDKKTEKCGQCDICYRKQDRIITKDQLLHYRNLIISQLKNGPKHPSSIDITGIPEKAQHDVIDYLRRHEEIVKEGNTIKLGKNSTFDTE